MHYTVWDFDKFMKKSGKGEGGVYETEDCPMVVWGLRLLIFCG